jgi:hypothetical protein
MSRTLTGTDLGHDPLYVHYRREPRRVEAMCTGIAECTEPGDGVFKIVNSVDMVLSPRREHHTGGAGCSARTLCRNVDGVDRSTFGVPSPRWNIPTRPHQRDAAPRQ